MANFMTLNLPIHEYGMFFHLFVCSLISLNSGLEFSLNRSFTSLVNCIPRHFILFAAIVNGSSFMIWLSACLLLVYKNASNFCTLILYPETLLKLLISLRRFGAAMIGFSRYRNIIWKQRQLDFLSSYLNTFYFSCLISLAKTMLNRSSERRHPCLVLVFKGNASSFWPFSMILAVGLS